jgi:hypothetical protein
MQGVHDIEDEDLPALPEEGSLLEAPTTRYEPDVPADSIRPNPWNPNAMSAEMYAKARASIRRFGFVDPVTVREVADHFQIIDGEHRWRAGLDEGLQTFPCLVLEGVTDDQARELTIILNDTRGEMQEDKLAALIQDLAKRRDEARLIELMPYDRSRIEQLRERRQIDWDQIEDRRNPVSRKRKGTEGDPFVERVFRLPKSSAEVIDEAIARVRSEDDIEQDWRALELIAADYLGS